MKMQISKAELQRFWRFPFIKFDRQPINADNVFSLSCITPGPTFWTRADKSLIESSATEAFLSQQF
jgi:hypothetical protein